MDIRDRVVGDQPQDFLHRIAGIVPGYDGYVDRERRRDADKILRTQLANRYAAQRQRLTRVQQDLLSAHRLDLIAEVDREVGALQRFIDRLSTATYGYTGLFDPIKVEAADLDQLYAFDMSLASGVGRVSAAIDAIEAAASSGGDAAHLQELPAAIGRLSSVLDDLNQRFNQRTDLLSSGNRLPDDQYRAMLSDINRPVSSSGEGGETGSGGADMGGGIEGTPTTDLNTPLTRQPGPVEETLLDDNQGFTEMPTGEVMRGEGPLPEPQTGTGIQTSSSPADHPGAPGGGIVEGLEMSGGASTPQVGMPSEAPAPQADVPDTLKPMGNQGQGQG